MSRDNPLLFGLRKNNGLLFRVCMTDFHYLIVDANCDRTIISK